MPALPRRSLLSWGLRSLLAGASYVLFYLIFGAVNYRLVTEPYYATHGGGLAIPNSQTVLLAEGIRAPLLAVKVSH